MPSVTKIQLAFSNFTSISIRGMPVRNTVMSFEMEKAFVDISIASTLLSANRSPNMSAYWIM